MTPDPSPPHATARTATVDDLGVVVELARAAVEEKRGQKGGDVWARRERRPDPRAPELLASLDDPTREVAVGALDGTVVGYGFVRAERLDDGGLLGVIDDIYVDPGARAVGVGEALMEHVIGWARTAGCFGVDSLALPGDRATKNFFESFGLVARAIVVHRPLT